MILTLSVDDNIIKLISAEIGDADNENYCGRFWR